MAPPTILLAAKGVLSGLHVTQAITEILNGFKNTAEGTMSTEMGTTFNGVKPEVTVFTHKHVMFLHCQPKETILFSFWKTESVVSLIFAAFLVLLMSLFMELMYFIREYRKKKFDAKYGPAKPKDRLKFRPYIDLLDPLLHFLQLVMASFLLLISSTFNLILFLFVVFGVCVSRATIRSFFPHVLRYC